MIERTENGKSIFTISTRLGYNDAELWSAVLRMNDPFHDTTPCFIMNNSDRWDGWGERSRWEPDYKNDDERQDARWSNKRNPAGY